MNYREVKCSDRLPEEEGYYWTNAGQRYFTFNWKGVFVSVKGCTEICTYVGMWFEPYELPTEGEIKELIVNIADDRELYDGDGGSIYCGALFPDQWDEAAKAITNLLKGEK